MQHETGGSPSGDRRLHSEYVFERFAVPTTCEVAYRHCLTFANHTEDGSVQPILWLVGPPGVGKTHLLQAIAHAILAKGGQPVWYASFETLQSVYVSATQKYRKDPLPALVKEGVVLIDDMPGDDPRSVERTVLALASSGARIVVAETQNQESGRFYEALKGMVQIQRVRLHRASQGQMKEILRLKTSMEGTPIADAKLHFLSQGCRGDVRVALGNLNRYLFDPS